MDSCSDHLMRNVLSSYWNPWHLRLCWDLFWNWHDTRDHGVIFFKRIRRIS